MAWIDVPEDSNWEYSNDPNTYKKSTDTYDYDANTDHALGIRTDGNQVHQKWYVLSRQKAPIDNPGYGELYLYMPEES